MRLASGRVKQPQAKLSSHHVIVGPSCSFRHESGILKHVQKARISVVAKQKHFHKQITNINDIRKPPPTEAMVCHMKL